MRTTLDIADDVLQAARELARRHRKTAGQVISELAREALAPRGATTQEAGGEELHGLLPFASRGGLVTNEVIDALGDDVGD
jgi:hypothetical protein